MKDFIWFITQDVEVLRVCPSLLWIPFTCTLSVLSDVWWGALCFNPFKWGQKWKKEKKHTDHLLSGFQAAPLLKSFAHQLVVRHGIFVFVVRGEDAKHWLFIGTPVSKTFCEKETMLLLYCHWCSILVHTTAYSDVQHSTIDPNGNPDWSFQSLGLRSLLTCFSPIYSQYW